MSSRILLEDEADQEFRAAAKWYEIRRAGLGQEFIDAVEATLVVIARIPRVGARVPRVPLDLRVRMAPVRRFPYHVVYIEEDTSTTLRVLAVAHEKRAPGYWLPRV